MLRHQDWRPGAAYVYILHLDGPALAWEYLRRHSDYQRDWRQHRRRPGYAKPWGLRGFEDPLLDARTAQPLWFTDPDNLTRLTVDPDATGAFDLWGAPGIKRMMHDGRRVLLTNACGHHQLRIAFDDSVRAGLPVAYLIRPDHAAVQWRAIEMQHRALAAVRAQRCPPVPRPGRAALLHMRGLQALDGDLAGASQRSIAVTLFGADAVEDGWDGDGGLRIQTRNLLQRARAYLRGGYRRLLSQCAQSAQGKSARHTDLP
jgi:hypothetical protein